MESLRKWTKEPRDKTYALETELPEAGKLRAEHDGDA